MRKRFWRPFVWREKDGRRLAVLDDREGGVRGLERDAGGLADSEDAARECEQTEESKASPAIPSSHCVARVVVS